MQYAHRLIETAEAANTGNFTDSQRNLIVNFAYKMDDKDEVLGLVNRMMTQSADREVNIREAL